MVGRETFWGRRAECWERSWLYAQLGLIPANALESIFVVKASTLSFSEYSVLLFQALKTCYTIIFEFSASVFPLISIVQRVVRGARRSLSWKESTDSPKHVQHT
jgi:hypothetical protein